MPTKVEYPFISMTLKNAIHEIVSPTFATTGQKQVGNSIYGVYACWIGHHLEAMQPDYFGQSKEIKPRIVFAGESYAIEKSYKCENRATKVLMQVDDLKITRTVFIAVPRKGFITRPATSQGQTEPVSYRIVDMCWGHLRELIDSSKAAFIERNIVRCHLEPMPIELPDEEYHIGRGRLEIHASVPHPRY